MNSDDPSLGTLGDIDGGVGVQGIGTGITQLSGKGRCILHEAIWGVQFPHLVGRKRQIPALGFAGAVRCHCVEQGCAGRIVDAKLRTGQTIAAQARVRVGFVDVDPPGLGRVGDSDIPHDDFGGAVARG